MEEATSSAAATGPSFLGILQDIEQRLQPEAYDQAGNAEYQLMRRLLERAHARLEDPTYRGSVARAFQAELRNDATVRGWLAAIRDPSSPWPIHSSWLHLVLHLMHEDIPPPPVSAEEATAKIRAEAIERTRELMRVLEIPAHAEPPWETRRCPQPRRDPNLWPHWGLY